MNVEKGYVDEPVADGTDLRKEIERLKKEQDAVVLAHYYQKGEIQDVADYIGDSLALARIAAGLPNRVIVLCGVHFMGETAKILCPDKIVIVPDVNAGCSLADSCSADAFEAFKETGDIFNPEKAKAFRENILSKGGSEDAMTLYQKFRGQEPSIDPLLKRKGLK